MEKLSAKYGEGNWYVEGVGESIKLIPEDDPCYYC